ncbi:helix-turn-helix domain-containing protein [Calderihabitans maritimus]|uniref:XRE family transcriptional regulator n=1 Tax=Calderihabitans maritimus TaxID=1246530 RepID=A0A1Z5HQD6_9FIRM|nr:helix-turn-helix domain-containing protein [Calderihabitans maritimus]GAW91739.1 XRE family transcriptional regulator [Calderihabitans maritimus]
MSIGEKLKKLREERHISLEELADKIGVPVRCLEDVEQGKKRLGSKSLKEIACLLGAPEDYFVTGDDEVEQEIDPPNETVEYISSAVGRRIRQLREEKGLTLVECGRRAGISYTHISEIERGNTCPSLKTLEKLARVLEVPLTYFLSNGSFATMGDRIRKLREAQGLTQAKLARQIGISDSLIAQVETGKAQPSLNTLERLADVLGVSPSYFLAKEDEFRRDNPVIPLKEWTVNKKIDTILELLQEASDQDLDFLAGLIRYLWEYRGHDRNQVDDPVIAQIVELLKKFTDEEKRSVLDYIKFIESRREVEAKV